MYYLKSITTDTRKKKETLVMMLKNLDSLIETAREMQAISDQLDLKKYYVIYDEGGNIVYP